MWQENAEAEEPIHMWERFVYSVSYQTFSFFGDGESNCQNVMFTVLHCWL